MKNEQEADYIFSPGADGVISLLLIPVNNLLCGWALEKVWNWNAAPVFSLPTISMSHATGMVMLILPGIVQATQWKEYDIPTENDAD